jgi:hypothetical protein
VNLDTKQRLTKCGCKNLPQPNCMKIVDSFPNRDIWMLYLNCGVVKYCENFIRWSNGPRRERKKWWHNSQT